MANDTSSNPFTIDTVTDTAITNDKFYVQSIVWTSSSTVGNSVVVADEAGNTKWQANADVVDRNIDKYFDPPLYFNGLKVATLTTGTVLLYVSLRG